MERLQEGRGALGGEFWNKRARRFSKGPMGSADRDPMLSRLRKAMGSTGTWTFLDVGSGPGRFALGVAPRASRVVAVDPSTKMLAILRRSAREAGLTNVKTKTGLWQDVDVAPRSADVVLCSHVLPLIADVVPFIDKLQAAARHQVFLYVGAYASDAIFDPFWRHFHGAPRRPGASWVDALAVLREMGIDPNVEVVELEARTRFDTLAEAVETYRDQLVLPGTPEVQHELTRLLDPWFQRRKDGLYAPFRTQPAAILSWIVQ
jgi:SAM-dependent methyltransferase